MDKAKRLKAIQDALPTTTYDPPSSPDQVAAHLLPQDAVDPSNLNADQIQSLILSLIAVPEYVKKLERKLLALQKSIESVSPEGAFIVVSYMFVTNFIWSYLHHFFDDSHGLKASLKPLRRPFDRCQSRLEAINNGRDIKQINW